MSRIIAGLPHRGTDDFGNGEFGAPRGNRTHKGIDYACYPGTEIHSTVYGEVTKLGYPYADALQFRYVEITDNEGLKHRFFYVEPNVDFGDRVLQGDVIGYAQDIAGHYNTEDRYMKGHIHYEILSNGEPINPEEF